MTQHLCINCNNAIHQPKTRRKKVAAVGEKALSLRESGVMPSSPPDSVCFPRAMANIGLFKLKVNQIDSGRPSETVLYPISNEVTVVKFEGKRINIDDVNVLLLLLSKASNLNIHSCVDVIESEACNQLYGYVDSRSRAAFRESIGALANCRISFRYKTSVYRGRGGRKVKVEVDEIWHGPLISAFTTNNSGEVRGVVLNQCFPRFLHAGLYVTLNLNNLLACGRDQMARLLLLLTSTTPNKRVINKTTLYQYAGSPPGGERKFFYKLKKSSAMLKNMSLLKEITLTRNELNIRKQ